MRIMGRQLALVGALAVPTGGAARAQGPERGEPAVVGSPAAAPAAGQQAAPVRPWRPVGVELSASSVYDTNIDHDLNGLHSYGTILGLSGAYRNRASHPSLVLEYEAALHRYTGTDRWDRLSQRGTATYARELGRWRMLSIADAALRGSSDDRKLDNRYTIMERARYRVDRTRRLQLSAALRLRRAPGEPGANAANPYGA
ncbi:MAG TPA: hypothetical protein VF832_14370, partial [Longimicrobiales bacterium]